jgi:late competence protein required for DNA uptake (superfamily II DNA/RNA helicase)
MRNVIDRIKSGHVLRLQEIDGMAFPLSEHCDENVRARYLLAARGLNVNCRALQDALKARSRLCVIAACGNEIGKLIVDVVQNLAAQGIEIDAASTQHPDRILILGKRQQQMFERGVFVPALIGVSESPMQRPFKIA